MDVEAHISFGCGAEEMGWGMDALADREGAVARVFGERMRAGWVGAGEVRRDVGDRLFQSMHGCGAEGAWMWIGCGCMGVEQGQDCSLAGGAAGKGMVGGEVLWSVRGRNMFGVAWWENFFMVPKMLPIRLKTPDYHVGHVIRVSEEHGCCLILFESFLLWISEFLIKFNFIKYRYIKFLIKFIFIKYR